MICLCRRNNLFKTLNVSCLSFLLYIYWKPTFPFKLKIRKTLYSWLTNKYTLIIRSEETFAEKRSLNFTYAKIIVFVTLYSFSLFTISYYVITGVLSTWLDPREQIIETKQRIVNLSVKVDSLSSEVDKKEQYISDLKKLFKDFRQEEGK